MINQLNLNLCFKAAVEWLRPDYFRMRFLELIGGTVLRKQARETILIKFCQEIFLLILY